MELNIDFNIKSTYDNISDKNTIRVLLDDNKSVLEHFTAMEMAKECLMNALDAYVKSTPNGTVTNIEFDNLVSTPIHKLKGFSI